MASRRQWAALLVVFTCSHVAPLPAPFTETELLARLQVCFRMSGMSELDASGAADQLEGRRAADAGAKPPSVSRRRDILQAFLDCCARQDLHVPATAGSAESEKQRDEADSGRQLRHMQHKIQQIYQKYLMGSSVGLNIVA